LQTMKEKKLRAGVCTGLVRETAKILDAML
jgi:hypothetical protein